MLENHLIDDLDQDLLLELDEVVRGNQLNCLPFVKSGRAELLLHERNPGLAEEIDEERERRIRDMAFRDTLKDDDGRLSSSYRARIGSLDDIMSSSPSQEKSRRRSRAPRNAPFSPTIRPKDSTLDLMFDMDDDDPLAPGSPRSPALKATSDETRIGRASSASIPLMCVDGESPTLQEEEFASLPSRPSGLGMRNTVGTPPSENTKTWSSPVLSSSKLGMREIMAQASSSRTSNLSMSLSAQKVKDDAKTKTPPPKLSQKERKKQQQQASTQSQTARGEADAKSAPPWQVTSTGSKTSLKDVLGDSKSSPSASPAQLGLPITPRSPTPRRTASPDTRFSGQARSVNRTPAKPALSSAGPSRNAKSAANSSPVIPHSKSYMAPAATAEPSLQLSMADIMGQQTREQEVIKEAVAKRSLQEIQEEQAFQEWWDQESRRAQEAEAARAKGPSPAVSKGSKAGGGRGKGSTRGRGGKGGGRRGRGQESA